jgi:hypothetical protein
MEFLKLIELQLGDSCLIGRRGGYVYDASTTIDHVQATIVGFPIGLESRVIVEIPDWGSNIFWNKINEFSRTRWCIDIADNAVGKFINLDGNTIVGVDIIHPNLLSSYPIPFIPSNEVFVGDTISWAEGNSLFYMFVEDIEEAEDGSEARVVFTGKCYSNIRSKTIPRFITKSVDPKIPMLLINRGSDPLEQKDS